MNGCSEMMKVNTPSNLEAWDGVLLYVKLFMSVSNRVMTATIKSPNVQNALIASYVTMTSPPLMRSNRPPSMISLALLYTTLSYFGISITPSGICDPANFIFQTSLINTYC